MKYGKHGQHVQRLVITLEIIVRNVTRDTVISSTNTVLIYHCSNFISNALSTSNLIRQTIGGTGGGYLQWYLTSHRLNGNPQLTYETHLDIALPDPIFQPQFSQNNGAGKIYFEIFR